MGRVDQKPNLIVLRWVLAMAWRDSRGHRRKLFLFTLCVIFGVGALVAIESFRHNLEQTIDDQAQLLLGADLSFRSQRPFSRKMGSRPARFDFARWPTLLTKGSRD